MAIEGNKSDVKVLNEKKLYTGLCNMRVVAINPDIEELKKLYKKVEKEPVYLVEKEGQNSKYRLDIYVKSINPDILTKLSLFVSPEHSVTKEGFKTEYIDDFGSASYTDEISNLKWVDQKSARIAFVGESALHDFIKKWINVPKEGKCKLDTMDKIVKGNVKELVDLMKSYPENEVKLMLGVRKNKYQGVYDKCFGYSYSDNNDHFIKRLENPRSPFFEHDYQNSLELKVFKAKLSEKPAEKKEDDLSFLDQPF